MKRKEQKIKCDVSTCVHNNCDDECCKLNEIKVSCNCHKDDVEKKDETICNNYKSCKEKSE